MVCNCNVAIKGVRVDKEKLSQRAKRGQLRIVAGKRTCSCLFLWPPELFKFKGRGVVVGTVKYFSLRMTESEWVGGHTIIIVVIIKCGFRRFRCQIRTGNWLYSCTPGCPAKPFPSVYLCSIHPDCKPTGGPRAMLCRIYMEMDSELCSTIYFLLHFAVAFVLLSDSHRRR